MKFMRPFFSVLFCFLSLFCTCFFASTAFSGETTRWGAKVVKETFSETDSPEVILPEGWKLCPGEAFTGVNPREYYFTVEAEGENRPAPSVKISWSGVKIAAVYGGECVRIHGDTADFRLNARRTPTSFTTVLPQQGAVSMGIFHNIPGLQAGEYRGKPYPKNEIQAQLNFLFAAREMMRDFGFTDSPERLGGVLNLYGFETNYPNGHVDAPPHFHIMTMWNSWKNVQACHFILDEKGKILCNDHYVVENGTRNSEKSLKFQTGESVSLTDRSGDVCFTLTMLKDGSGLEMSVPGTEKRGRIQSSDAVQSVTYSTRETPSDAWIPAVTVRVQDDAAAGKLEIFLEKNGETTTETWNYDPNTGSLREKN